VTRCIFLSLGVSSDYGRRPKGSEGQAKRYAKQAEMRYGLKKKKKKKVTGSPTPP
jgi:hypothetical protein